MTLGTDVGLLWLESVLLAAVVISTAGPAWRILRGIRWWPATLVLGLAAPLVVWLLLPQAEYHFAGHECAYGELLDGGLPLDELDSHQILPVPSGLAAALGWLLPSQAARWCWLALNRASLGLLVLLAGACAALVARRRGQDEALAGLLGVVGAWAVTPLFAWSATAWAVTPASAAGALALCFGLAGRPAACLAWGALALGTRMEAAVLLLAGGLAVLSTGWSVLATRKPALVGALLVLAVQGLALASKGTELPLESTRPELSVLLENLRCLALGGAWLTPWAAVGMVATLAARRADARVWWPLAGAGVAALIQPLGLVDVGARHLAPAGLLAAVLLAGLAPGRWGRSLATLVLAPALVVAFGATRDLSHRYAAGVDAHLPAWVEAADRGRSGRLEELLDEDCYLVLPHGEADHPGAAPSGDVREIHNAARERHDGGCVQWAVHTDAEFLGDTAAERLDRARLVLGLTPSGWVLAPGGDRWLLWEAR